MKKSPTQADTTDFSILGLARPAQRALLSAGIKNLRQLKKVDPDSLHALHGIGPQALARIKHWHQSSKTTTDSS